MGKLICICALIAAVPGAAADDIQRRIDDASARGGGVVKVRAGGRASTMRNILIENVEGEAASLVSSSITGVPGLRPRDITLRNVRLRMPGGGTAGEVCRKVPEMERAYPENRMFKMQMLPAYGFYVRHADGVRFENVELSYAGDEERPAITLDDAAGTEMAGCRLKPPSGPHPAILRRSCSTNGVRPPTPLHAIAR